ncbi:MAG: hypothetical protein ACJ8CB_02850 [Ktedonobacteraceae bacterium]
MPPLIWEKITRQLQGLRVVVFADRELKEERHQHIHQAWRELGDILTPQRLFVDKLSNERLKQFTPCSHIPCRGARRAHPLRSINTTHKGCGYAQTCDTHPLMLRQAESYTVPIQSTEAVAACGAEKVMIVSKLPRGPSTTRTDWPGKSIPFCGLLPL